MSLWIIEPRDPLIARDGRPFDAGPGARAVSLPFPFPSTLAGAARTRVGSDEDGEFRSSNEIARLQQISVHGPLLARCLGSCNPVSSARPNPSETTAYEVEGIQLLPPAPLDALLLEAAQVGTARRKRLAPLLPADDDWVEEENFGYPFAIGEVGTLPSLPSGAPHPAKPHAATLFSVGMLHLDAEASKPLKEAPRFWTWPNFEQWLHWPEKSLTSAETADGSAETNSREEPSLFEDVVGLDQLGITSLQAEARFHPSIDPESLANIDGALFSTRGLRFTRQRADGTPERLVLAARISFADTSPDEWTALPEDFTLGAGPGPVGGERRIAFWQRAHCQQESLSRQPAYLEVKVTNQLEEPAMVDGWPHCPQAVREAIADSGGCRVILLTPALFEQGWVPRSLLAESHGVRPRLVGAACGRAQTVSGWDLAHRRPKPARRMAPAGSVYFLFLEGTPERRREWVDAHWMQCISDRHGDNDRDGDYKEGENAGSNRNTDSNKPAGRTDPPHYEQDCRDGFGLCALGAWPGRPLSRAPVASSSEAPPEQPSKEEI